MNTTTDKSTARKFTGSMQELINEVLRLQGAGKIDGYSIHAVNREYPIVRIMGVRIGSEWSYLADD